MSPLGKRLARRIRLQGPISIADFMAEALGHPKHGYYMRGDPLGRAGDFITAPEISQVFGELIGLWCAEIWRLMDRPHPFNLVELGPGRGTLMQDALRAARVLPGFAEAARLQLVETSPALRTVQATTLAAHAPAWCDDVTRIADGPLIVIANEFFDALPIRQFQRAEDGWRERLVGVDGDRLRMTVTPSASPAAALIPETVRQSQTLGAIAEVSPASLSLVAQIAERIDADGGAALIVDYGHGLSAPGDTFQAVRGHEPQDVLDDPGLADLTAHVDFAALAEAARPHAAVYGPLPQGELLRRLGIEMRQRQLTDGTDPDQRKAIETACRRLIDPSEMGTLFKALALCHRDMAAPPGFEG